jgi:ribosome recycling factor
MEETQQPKSFDHETMKIKIEKMDKQQHIEILKMIKTKNPSLNTNENKNGTWINMSCLNEETLEELSKYIEYIEQQEKSLNTIESEKKELMKTFFV